MVKNTKNTSLQQINRLNKSLNIAFVANTSWYLYNLRKGVIEAMINQGHQVSIITEKDNFTQELIDLGCVFVSLRIDDKGTSFIQDTTFYLFLSKLFKSKKYDIIFNHTIKPNIYGSIAARRNQIPAIAVVSGLGRSFLKKNWLYYISSFLYKTAARAAHQVWFVNSEDKAVFEGWGIQATKLKKLAGEGVNTDYFKPQKKENNGTIKFIMTSRLIWEKGVMIYIEAAKKIQQKYPNTEFLLLGFADDRDTNRIPLSTIQAAEQQKIISFHGFKHDVRPYIQESDCFVLPSYYAEGLPRSLLEAAAMAKPIITTDNVGCREIVKDNENGFLCQPKSVDDLIQKIEKFILLDDERKKIMGAKGREIVVNDFNEKNIISSYLDALNYVIEKQ